MFMVSEAVLCDFLSGLGLCKPIPARNGGFSDTPDDGDAADLEDAAAAEITLLYHALG